METSLELHRSWIQKNQASDCHEIWTVCIKCGCHGQQECKHEQIAGHCALNVDSMCPCCAKLMEIEKFTRSMKQIAGIENDNEREYAVDMLMYRKLRELGFTEGCSLYRSIKGI